MPVQLWCAPGVFLAAVREDVVVLDVTADRYDCLLDAADWLTIQADGSLQVPDDAVGRDLLSAGIASVVRPATPRPMPPAPGRDLPASPPVSRLARLRAGLALAGETLAFRGKSLAQLVDTARRPPRPSALDAPLALHVAALRGALPWVPFEGECLQRGFLLKRALARRGIRADWVFGVRTWPFAAHCWLQVDDIVIADTLERVRRYTPIMAV